MRAPGGTVVVGTMSEVLMKTDSPLRSAVDRTRDWLFATVHLQMAARPRESEERYRMLIEQVRDYAIFLLDPLGRVVSWNAGAALIQGYQSAEIIGESASLFYVPEDIADGAPARELRSASANGRHEAETWRIRKDGSRFRAHVVLTALHDSDGALCGFTEVSRDVTERHATEARYRGLLEAAPDAMVIVNRCGEIVLLNLQAERVFGYRRDELLGQKVTNIIPEGFAERLIAGGADSSGTPIIQQMGIGLELHGRRKDGSEFPIEIMLSPLESAEGTLVTAAIRDITRRKTAEEHLMHAEARYRGLLEAAPDPMVVVNQRGEIVLLNLQAEKVFGHRRDELLGEKITNIIPEGFGERFIPEANGSAAEGIIRAVPELFGRRRADHGRRKDGSEFPVRISATSSSFDGEKLITAILCDITEQVREDERRQAKIVVSQILAEARSFGEGVSSLLSSVGELLGWMGAFRWNVDVQRKRLACDGVWYATGSAAIAALEARGSLEIGFGEGVCGAAWESGNVRQASDHLLVGSERLRLEVQRVALPISTHENVCAVLEFYVPQPEPLDDAVMSMFQDLTKRISEFAERRSGENKLRHSEATLSEAQHIARLGSWSYDVRTGKLASSRQTFKMFGVGPAEFDGSLSSYLDAACHPDDRANVDRMLSAPIPSPAYEFMYRTHPRDAAGHVLDCRVQLAAGTLEEPLTLVGTIQDVTDRVNAEGTIWRLSRQNDLLLTHASQGIIGLDRAGKVTFVNPAASKLSGWSRDELLAAPSIEEMLHGRKSDGTSCPPSEGPMSQTLTDGIARNGRERFFRKTGESFPVELSCAPIYEESEITGCVAIFEDVSERVRLEQQVEQSLRISTLGHVAATIAHEFNNVLMGIQPFAELIRQRANGDHTLTKASSQIISSVTRGKRVTQEILQFTQPVEPALQVVDAEAWLGGILPELRAMIGQRIELALELPSEKVMIRCDALQLQQVLINLALNARDAMSRGGKITIALSADRSRAREGMAVLSVADSGCGMTGKVLESIFVPLFTTKRTGTGLGLAVAQQVVARNGGSIHGESTPGAGTTFYIAIPLAGSSHGSAEVVAPRALLHVTRILLVEDEPAVAAGVVALLETEGIEVAVVGQGAEAVAAANSLRPDAVILDLTLPDIQGTEVYERLAARWPDLPVIFSTGHGDETALKPYLSSPHVGFLRKPYDFAALTAMLQKVCGTAGPNEGAS